MTEWLHLSSKPVSRLMKFTGDIFADVRKNARAALSPLSHLTVEHVRRKDVERYRLEWKGPHGRFVSVTFQRVLYLEKQSR